MMMMSHPKDHSRRKSSTLIWMTMKKLRIRDTDEKVWLHSNTSKYEKWIEIRQFNFKCIKMNSNVKMKRKNELMAFWIGYRHYSDRDKPSTSFFKTEIKTDNGNVSNLYEDDEYGEMWVTWKLIFLRFDFMCLRFLVCVLIGYVVIFVCIADYLSFLFHCTVVIKVTKWFSNLFISSFIHEPDST